MKKVFYLLPVAMLLCASVVAQKANIDSLTLLAQIGQDQLQLGKLQNMVDQKTRNQQGAAMNAQNSANNNENAAEQLSADPNNKQLASNASSKAGEAKSDARKSRKQSGKLDDLNKAIIELKSKIAVEQSKLSIYCPVAPAPVVTAVSVIVDTTGHP